MSEAAAAEEAIKKFENHDWSKDARWQLYWNNLYPTPELHRVAYWRRRWFRQNVDEHLPSEEVFASRATTSGSSAASSSTAAPQAATAAPSVSQSFVPVIKSLFAAQAAVTLCVAAVACLILYILPIGRPKMRRHASILFSVAFLMDALCYNGTPQMTMVWLRGFLTTNSTVRVMLAATAAFMPTWIAHIPAVLTAMLILASHFHSVIAPLLKNRGALALGRQVATRVNNGRYQLMQRRANMDVTLVAVGLVMKLLTTRMSILSLFLYANALRMCYPLDAFMQSTFRRLHQRVQAFLSKPALTGVLKCYQNVAVLAEKLVQV